jgi:hypothetical protein
MVLFEFACQRQLEALGMADNVAYIVSKLKAKLDKRSNLRRLFRIIPSQCSLTQENTALLMAKVSQNTDSEIDLYHQQCFHVCFPALYVVQVKNSSDKRDKKGNSMFNSDRQSYNIDITPSSGPMHPHPQYLNKLRDACLQSTYNTTTLRCAAISMSCDEVSADVHQDVVSQALQDAASQLLGISDTGDDC